LHSVHCAAGIRVRREERHQTRRIIHDNPERRFHCCSGWSSSRISESFRELNWTGTFGDYLDIVARNPKVTRNAFQRIYDMIMSYGYEEFIDAKKKLIRYHFFSDPSFRY
jgi:hypothetical protein